MALLALLAVVIVVGIRSCVHGSRLTFDAPLADDGLFEPGTVEADELSRLRTAADYSADNGGLSLLVIRGQEVLFEEYANGNASDQPIHLFSGTKSFCCALAVAAMADGKLRLDELASDTLTEWRDDPQKRRITVQQLLELSSGLKQDFRSLTLDGLKKLEHQRVYDKYQYAVDQPMVSEPGHRFSYGSVNFAAFGELLSRKLGENPLAYLQRRVLDPIGARTAGWHTDPAGNPQFGYGAWTTARHWARYGVLLRDGGRWQGKQILPTAELARCTRPSTALPAYGLALWLNQPLGQDVDLCGIPMRRLHRSPTERPLDPAGPADLYAAAGFKDQRLYVIPSLGLVVVRLGNGAGSFSDPEFLGRLLRGRPPPRE